MELLCLSKATLDFISCPFEWQSHVESAFKFLKKVWKPFHICAFISSHLNCHISHYKLFLPLNQCWFRVKKIWSVLCDDSMLSSMQTQCCKHGLSNLHCFNDRIVKLYTINIQCIVNVFGNPNLNQCWSNSSIYPTSILCCINLNICNNVRALIQWVMSFKWCPHIESMVTIDYASIQCWIY